MLVSSTMLILVTLSAEALIGIFGIMYLLKLVLVVISFAASCVITSDRKKKSQSLTMNINKQESVSRTENSSMCKVYFKLLFSISWICVLPGRQAFCSRYTITCIVKQNDLQHNALESDNSSINWGRKNKGEKKQKQFNTYLDLFDEQMLHNVQQNVYWTSINIGQIVCLP